MAAAFAALLCRPGDRGGGYDEYFAAVNGALKEKRTAQPAIVLDLDRVDANIRLLKCCHQTSAEIPDSNEITAFAELLAYIMRESGNRRLMPFHSPTCAPSFEKEGPGDRYGCPGVRFP